MLLCFPFTIRKKANVTQAIDADMITVNNFFTHWIWEISIKRYGDDLAILPLNNVTKTDHYSEVMLRDFPEKLLKHFKKSYFIVTKRLC